MSTHQGAPAAGARNTQSSSSEEETSSMQSPTTRLPPALRRRKHVKAAPTPTTATGEGALPAPTSSLSQDRVGSSSSLSPSASPRGQHASASSVTSPSSPRTAGQFPSPVTLLPPSASSSTLTGAGSPSSSRGAVSSTRAKIEQRRDAASRGALSARSAAAPAKEKPSDEADRAAGTPTSGTTTRQSRRKRAATPSSYAAKAVPVAAPDARLTASLLTSQHGDTAGLTAGDGDAGSVGGSSSNAVMRGSSSEDDGGGASQKKRGTTTAVVIGGRRPGSRPHPSRGGSSASKGKQSRAGAGDEASEDGSRSTGRSTGSSEEEAEASTGAMAIVMAFVKTVLHSFLAQSLFSRALTVSFHAMHLLIILTLLFSPMLLRSTVFSSQTLARTLLQAQGDIAPGSAHKSGGSEAPLPVAMAVENIWAIHDAVFFLEPGHTVVAADIEDSFQTLTGGHRRKKKNNDKKDDHKGGTGDGDDADKKDANDDDDDGKDNGGVGYLTSSKVDGEDGSGGEDAAKTNRASRALAMRALASAPSALTTGDYRLGSRKKSTKGKNSLSKVASAWEASPLYSSPLALSLYYYFYCIAAAVMLMTITEGRLTGHLAIARIVVVTSELFWYLHHGFHSFVVYVWLVGLSHWPEWLSGGKVSKADEVFLRRGTPYAAIERGGEVQFHWYYLVGDAAKDGMNGAPVVQGEMNMEMYLYAHASTIAAAAKVTTTLLLATFLGCWLRDATRVLFWLTGVQSIWEPEGLARCPLCGELMEPAEAVDHHRRRRQSRFAWLFPFANRAPSPGKATKRGRASAEGEEKQRRDARQRSEDEGGEGAMAASDAGDAATAVETTRSVRTNANEGRDTAAATTTPSLCARVWWWSLGPVSYTWSAVGSVLRSRATKASALTAEASRSGFYLQAGKPLALGPRRRNRRRTRAGADHDSLTTSSSSSSSSEEETEEEEESSEGDDLSVSTDTTEEDEKEGGIVRVIPQSGAAAAAATTTATTPGAGSTVGTTSSHHKRGSDAVLHRRPSSTSVDSGDGEDRAGRARRASSTASSLVTQPQRHLAVRRYRREQRARDERAYLRHVTRHVHHRCPMLHLDAVSSSEASESSDEEEETEEEESSDEEDVTETDEEASSSEAEVNARMVARDAPTAVALGAANPSTRRAVSAQGPPPPSGVAVWLASTPAPAAVGMRDHSTTRTRRAPKVLQPRLQIPDAQPSPATLSRVHSGSTSLANSVNLGTGTAPSFGSPPRRGRAPVHDTFAAGGGGSRTASGAAGGAQHIVARGRYDPFDDEDDELRPGNAFPCYERAHFASQVTLSWLNSFVAFAMLEPTLLRNERFLPALPKQEMALDNVLVPAWLLWTHRRVWYRSLISPPEGVLIPTEQVLDRAEEFYWPTPLNAGVTAAGVRNGTVGVPDGSAEVEPSEESSETQTVVLLGQQSSRKAINNANLRAQRPRRGRAERFFMTISTPFRYVLRKLFMWFYISRSQLIQRTQQHLIRALLKDRLTQTLVDQGSAANVEEGMWLLAEMVSTESRSSDAETTGSLLPSHTRHQLALGDVGLFRLFLEHRAGRRFLYKAGPLLLLSDVLAVSAVPALGYLIHALSPHAVEPSTRTSSVAKGALYADSTAAVTVDFSNAFSACSLLFVVLFLQSIVYQQYACQVQLAAMETRTTISAVVLEKVFALPLAQRIFSEEEVVHLVAVEGERCAEILMSLHHVWSNPLCLLLSLMWLWVYLGWQSAAVALVVLMIVIPTMRHDSARTREKEREAPDGRVRYHLLDAALAAMLQVKALVMEGLVVQRIRELRHSEALAARDVASAVAQAAATAEGSFTALIALCLFTFLYCGGEPNSSAVLPALMALYLMWTPLTEFPSLFVSVAKGYLSVKRLEAFLRQAPDEFVGTWIDLTAMRQRWEDCKRRRRAQRQAQRAAATTEVNVGGDGGGGTEATAHTRVKLNETTTAAADTFLVGQWGESDDDDDVDDEAGHMLYRRGSLVCRGASFTWQHDLTRDVPRPLLREVHMTVLPGELVVVQGPAGAGKSSLLLAVLGEINRCVDVQADNDEEDDDWERRLRRYDDIEDDDDTISELSVVSFNSRSGYGSTPQFLASPHGAPEAVQAMSSMSLGSTAPSRTASVASSARGKEPHRAPSSKKRRRPPRTESFQVFGSCVYTAESPWLMNDTVRANITAGGLTSDVRWYHTVVRACALDKDFLHSFPNGDQTVVGEKGFVLTSSQKVRIALARAVFTRADIYLIDSIFTVMDSATRTHVVDAVFHKLLRNKTVMVASNVALATLKPHRVFTVLSSGIVREDTHLYKTIASPRGGEGAGNKSHTEEEEELMVESPPDDDAHNQLAAAANADDEEDVVQLPNLYAEEIEEPEVSETEARRQDDEDDEMNTDDADMYFDDEEVANESEWWRQHSGGSSAAHSDIDTDYSSGTSSSGSDAYDTSSWSDDDAVSTDTEDDGDDGEETQIKDGSVRVVVKDTADGGNDAHAALSASAKRDRPLRRRRRHRHRTQRRSRQRRSEHSRRRHRRQTRENSSSTDEDDTDSHRSDNADGEDTDEGGSRSSSLASGTASSRRSARARRHDAKSSDTEGSESADRKGKRRGASTTTTSGSRRSSGSGSRDSHAHHAARRRRRRRAQKAHIASHHEAQTGLESLRLLLMFMGGQSVYLVAGTLLQHLLRLSLDVWIGYYLAAMALVNTPKPTEAEEEAASTMPKTLRSDYAFAIVFGTLVVTLMLVVRVRVPIFIARVFLSIHALYQQAVERVFLASPQLFLSPRIPRVLLGILTKDMNVAEHGVPASAEILISGIFQCATVALYNAFVNPCFLLVLPICYFLFQRVTLSFGTVNRELRRLESRCRIGTLTILREVYQGAPTIRCLSLQERLREEYCHALDTTNTAVMAHYMVERWTALRLQWVTVLTASTAGMLGVLFAHPQRRPLAPSFVGVAVIACWRLSRVLPTVCRRSSRFSAQWMPLQRLMELLRLPVERLTVRGKAQLDTYHGLVPQLRAGLATDTFDGQAAMIHFVRTEHGEEGELPANTGTGATVGSPTAPSLAASSPRRRASPTLRATAAEGSPSSDTINVVLPALELVDVSARYRRCLPLALNHMNLVVYPRERLGIIGPSGHGKSTIFNVLLRLLGDLVEGGVYVNGEDVDYVPYPILRSLFGVIPEEPFVVDGTWRENLLFGYHPLSPFDKRGDAAPWMLPLPTIFRASKATPKTGVGASSHPHTTPRTGDAVPLLADAADATHYGAVDHRDDGRKDESYQDDMVFGDSFVRAPPHGAAADHRQAPEATSGRADSRRARRVSLAGDGPAQGPLQAAEDAALWAALSAVGLQQTALFDGGLDADMANGDVADLEWSLSQRRLLCIARAVLHKPAILLVEDAYMGRTDADADATFARLLRDELKDTTVVFIGHRQRVVCDVCTRVVVVEHGHVSKVIEPRLVPSDNTARGREEILRFTDEAKKEILRYIE